MAPVRAATCASLSAAIFSVTMRCVSDRRPWMLSLASRIQRSAITPCASHASPIACRDSEHQAFQIRIGLDIDASRSAFAGTGLNLDRSAASRFHACPCSPNVPKALFYFDNFDHIVLTAGALICAPVVTRSVRENARQQHARAAPRTDRTSQSSCRGNACRCHVCLPTHNKGEKIAFNDTSQADVSLSPPVSRDSVLFARRLQRYPNNAMSNLRYRADTVTSNTTVPPPYDGDMAMRRGAGVLAPATAGSIWKCWGASKAGALMANGSFVKCP